ncbi:MAG: bacillithiol system redox-active protein YtxJ [Bacteroidetes bacterium]|jgi:thioredoxin 1|nr:bacillithiol system redox-active protein YtxJ [Bacteroidota bacterium]
MAFHPLTSADDLADALAASQDQPIVLYKHSATCPLSARARRQVQPIAEGAVPTYEVVVQQARPVSNQISSELGIRHETPQVLIVHNGTVVFDASHTSVTTAAIQEGLQTAAA